MYVIAFMEEPKSVRDVSGGHEDTIMWLLKQLINSPAEVAIKMSATISSSVKLYVKVQVNF